MSAGRRVTDRRLSSEGKGRGAFHSKAGRLSSGFRAEPVVGCEGLDRDRRAREDGKHLRVPCNRGHAA